MDKENKERKKVGMNMKKWVNMYMNEMVMNF